MDLNEPKILILFGVLGSIVIGCTQPFFGWIFAQMMGFLTSPLKLNGGKEGLMEKVTEKCQILALLAMANYFSVFIQRKSFLKLSENVTFKLRQLLYSNILQKNIGWFDLKENQTGVLTSSMASDTAIVNAASAEAAGPVFEGIFAFFGGVCVALYFCWQLALICMCICPLLSVAQGI